MIPSYVAPNRKELFESSSPPIKALIAGGEVKNTTTTLGEVYKIPAGEYVGLSNIICYVLTGALAPEKVVDALKEIINLSDEDAIAVASDLEKGIFQKARNIALGKTDEVITLEFKGEKSKEDLREEIMDTTKRESAIDKPQVTAPAKKTSIITPGSRSQLLEQLQVLGNIPNDAEIESRLSKIQEQISSIKKKEEATNTLDSNIALKSFMFGEKGKETVSAKQRTATYSVAPTQYNIDPYRELSED